MDSNPADNIKDKNKIQNLPKGISLADVQKHDISPKHVRNLRIEELDIRKEKIATPATIFGRPPPPPIIWI